MSDVTPVRTALLSCFDKTGVAALGGALAAHGVRLVSTGSTAGVLRDAGLEVVEVADLTGFPECLGGRVSYSLRIHRIYWSKYPPIINERLCPSEVSSPHSGQGTVPRHGPPCCPPYAPLPLSRGRAGVWWATGDSVAISRS